MANKNTNMILAVAVIAVCAIAIIGVGYAYTATTDNTGNDSAVKYITLTQGDPENYANAFDKEITYDTVTAVVNNTVETTYTLSANQTLTDVASGKKGIALGEVVITAEKTNTEDGFIFSVTDNSSTDPQSSVKMTGVFYIGIRVDTVSGTTTTPGTEFITLYEANQINYYTGATTAAQDPEDAEVITEDSNDKAVIHVKMYYVLSAQTTSEPDAKPLEGVTFTFKADAPHTSTPSP